MTRICPFCKSKLGLYDRYFCTSCGNTLPAELTESSSSQKKVVRHEVKSSKKISVNLEKIANLLLVVFSALALILILYRLLFPVIIEKKITLESLKKAESSKTADQSVSEKIIVNPVVVASRNVISPNCSFLIGSLIDPNLGKLVPYEVDLYMESNDSRIFLKEIVDSEIVSDSKFKDFYDAQKSNFLGPMGFFVTKTSTNYIYGIVLMLKDVSNKDKISEKYNISFVGSYAVLVTEKSAVEEIEGVVKGLEKNLVLNPVYASAKSALPKEGKLFILPITKNGKGFLYQLLDKKLTDEMSSIVNSFLDSKLDYAVVL